MIDTNLAAVMHDQEQDEAAAVEWINATSDECKVQMWLAIQRIGGTAERELISRFAQLGMTHAVLLAERMKSNG